jgi:hypothetical protein
MRSCVRTARQRPGRRGSAGGDAPGGTRLAAPFDALTKSLAAVAAGRHREPPARLTERELEVLAGRQREANAISSNW